MRIAYTESDVDLLARLMRAEAEGEGQQGMLDVGNVGVNRVMCDCLDFKGITNIQQMVYQQQGGNYSFEAVTKGYFYQRARETDKELARKCLEYWRGHPATNSLWFFNPVGNCPPVWWDQTLAGQYKEHCFYKPKSIDCPKVYSGK
ncbi:cell wall hydrolase [Bacillus arachidis]|uniref:cell wall hydrolase n=1 Tax=Bacillus arachidis TaxID=2819290 RepID=UPI00255C9933|nr:cell wall hydrolase [Bacillus arachidis]WIY63446.1 cell wall hydrolase [Bacillus arachidis]